MNNFSFCKLGILGGLQGFSTHAGHLIGNLFALFPIKFTAIFA
jgi:hypothetical protein